MNSYLERKIYLAQVVESRHNGMIKIITGVRRSGKSFLLFDLDLGLRNARLNLRQLEKTHMMENIIYNELRVN